MRDVYVADHYPLYVVMVDGKPYDSFDTSGNPLTWTEQWDVAEGYREGLTSNC